MDQLAKMLNEFEYRRMRLLEEAKMERERLEAKKLQPKPQETPEQKAA